jgi:hypothetical protein
MRSYVRSNKAAYENNKPICYGVFSSYSCYAVTIVQSSELRVQKVWSSYYVVA